MPFPLLREAEILRWLLDARGYSILSLAAWLGKKKGYLENRLALLQLPDDLHRLVDERPDTLSAALQLAKIDDPQFCADLTSGVRDGLLTVEAIRSEMQALRSKLQNTSQADVAASPEVAALPPGSAASERAITAGLTGTFPGETSIQRIVIHWKSLWQDETLRPGMDTALARIQETIAATAAVFDRSEQMDYQSGTVSWIRVVLCISILKT